MCKNEIIKAETQIKAFGKKISSDKKLSEEFLINIGIITAKGNIRKPYKELCTQHAQD